MSHSGGPLQFQLDLGDCVEPPAPAAAAATPEAIFARVFRVLRPRTPLPQIHIRWRPYANVHSAVRQEAGTLSFKISDLLQTSPESVLEALGYLLIGKLYRKQIPKTYVHRYNLYLNRRDVRRDLERVRQTRGRKFLSGSKGEFYDLAPMFEDLNRHYFDGMMACPQLGWSRNPSKQLLGHFDAGHNAIIISRIFDSRKVPRIALEFVLYHEMLHLRFPTQYRGARRCIHSAEFKKAEREFASWKEANEILKRL